MDTTQIITGAHNSYELLKILLQFIGTIAWPIAILVIITLFKKQIQKLFENAKKIELPGVLTFEIEKEIGQAKQLATEIKNERTPEAQKLIDTQIPLSESEANKRMIQLGLNPSPSGLNLNYYKNIADSDPRLALVGLRFDFELMARNLAKGYNIPVSEKDSVAQITNKLYSNNFLTTKQRSFLDTVFSISNSASQGAEISKRQAYEIIDIGQVLVEDYVAWLHWGFRDK